MANRITVVLEALGFDKGATSVKGFRQSILDADTTTGKFKAGFGAATDYVKEHAGAMALGAGTALVAFGVKAVGAFTDTAKAAIDLGSATGLATEDASRWIAIGDDMGVTAEQLTSSLGKVGKTLDGASWDKYGIATRDAGGNARSTNDILLDSLDMLSGVKNETERAKIGNELFGKGYANLAPLIGRTRDEYEDMLGTVEDGQVITKKEAERAERMRLAQDKLGDAIQELTLNVGGFVAGFAPMIEDMADGIAIAQDLTSALADIKLPDILGGDVGSSLKTGLNAVFNPMWSIDKTVDGVSAVGDALGFTGDEAEESSGKVDGWRSAFEKIAPVLDDASEKAAWHQHVLDGLAASSEFFTKRAELMAQGTEDTRDEFEKAADAADTMRTAIEKVTNTGRSMEQASQDWEEGVDDLTESFKENGATIDKTTEKGRANRDAIKEQVDTLLQDYIPALIGMGKSNEDAAADVETMQHALVQQLVDLGLSEEAAAEYINQLGLTPEEIKTTIELANKEQMLIDLQDIIAKLDRIELPHRTTVSVGTVDPGKRRAAGGYAAGATLVGELGPEVVDLPSGSQVFTAGQTERAFAAAAGTTVIQNITNNWPSGAIPRDVIAAKQYYDKWNGGPNVPRAA